MRAALYHRVSTLDQNKQAAFDELMQSAKQRGLEVVLTTSETGSGANNDRPGLLEVLDWARRGKIDQVLVWKLDRFGQSALDLLANLQTLDNAGVGFTVTTQGIDMRPGGDPMSRLLLTMLAAVAQFERELIRERTRTGMAAAKRAGKHVGRPKRAARRWTLADVGALRAEGLELGQIAAELDCSLHDVQHALAALRKGGGEKRTSAPSRK